MKYAVFSIICLSFISLGIATQTQKVLAAVTTNPFGGQILITGPQGNFICTGGTGPVTQRSVGKAPASYYFYKAGTSQPKAKDWVLGLYDTVPNISNCYYQMGPYRVPGSVYNVTLFGKSK